MPSRALLAALIAVAALPPASAAASGERRCRTSEARSLVETFVAQFNAGHTRRLDRMWAREPDFQWYSTSAPGERLNAASRNRSTLMRYFARRHRAGERLRLTSFKFNGNAAAPGEKPYGNFEYTLERRSSGLAPTHYDGKGAAHCRRTGPDDLFVWSMSPTSGTAASAVLAPPVHALFSYQIGGAFPPAPRIGIVDRDRLASPAPGFYNVCYVNAFQSQANEHRWWLKHHHRLLLFRHGHAVNDGEWNEQLLDTSTAAKRRALARIVGGWMAGCARAGFNAVEPDNLDSWSRSKGALTVHDNLAFAAALTRRAHGLGLAIAQKNAAEVTGTGKRIGFDFAIAEECQAYSECGSYTRAYGRHVIEIEYPDNGGRANFDAACRARGSRISVVYRDRDVVAAGERGYVERFCPA